MILPYHLEKRFFLKDIYIIILTKHPSKMQIYHKFPILNPKKKKTEKLWPLFCRNQSTLLQLLHYVKKVKQFARECILKLFKIQNKRVYP